MSGQPSILQQLRELHAKFGLARTLKHASFRLVNRFAYLDCLHIIALERSDLKPLDAGKVCRLSTKMATRTDLEAMQEEGCWEINERKLEFFDHGDACLLSYVDGELAGYTWAHTRGCPEIIPGLILSVPRAYLYNFAAFTLPKYRGYGLQSFRHHALLACPQWQDRKGLLGYVIHTNYKSKRGQHKSGYQKIGRIWVIGSKSRFCALIGRDLRRLGIRRIDCAPPVRLPEASLRVKERLQA